MAIRVISVNYGHNGSGKLYDYETDKQYRAGDTLVVPVTHPKSGTIYNTLAIVRATYSGDTEAGQRKLDHLTDPKNDINPKNVSQRLAVARAQGLDVTSDRQVTVRTLPGYDNRASNNNWSGVDNSAEAVIARNTQRLISRNTRSAS